MPPVKVKDAVFAAIRFLSDIQENRSPEDVAVEEVELSDDEKLWNITLGYYPPGTSMGSVIGRTVPRQYRVFRVNSQTGEVVSMKIRDLSS